VEANKAMKMEAPIVISPVNHERTITWPAGTGAIYMGMNEITKVDIHKGKEKIPPGATVYLDASLKDKYTVEAVE
jgi:hypothetical protein